MENLFCIFTNLALYWLANAQPQNIFTSIAYIVSENPLSFSDAKLNCKNRQATLVEIQTKDVQTLLKNLFDANYSDGNYYTILWLKKRKVIANFLS